MTGGEVTTHVRNGIGSEGHDDPKGFEHPVQSTE